MRFGVGGVRVGASEVGGLLGDEETHTHQVAQLLCLVSQKLE